MLPHYCRLSLRHRLVQWLQSSSSPRSLSAHSVYSQCPLPFLRKDTGETLMRHHKISLLIQLSSMLVLINEKGIKKRKKRKKGKKLMKVERLSVKFVVTTFITIFFFVISSSFLYSFLFLATLWLKIFSHMEVFLGIIAIYSWSL